MEFIPIAEETGDIVPIGRWVLRQACRQMSEWQSQFSEYPFLMISVNISSAQITQSEFTRELCQILEETNLDAGSLSLEITESMIVENTAIVKATLDQLKDMYVQLHVDDFGTGYASLSYLHRFPIDALKVDRSFVTELGHDSRNAEIVHTIAKLANNLKMDVVAEGVETAQQLQYLRRLNFHYAQGYYFARPADRDEIRKVLAANPQW